MKRELVIAAALTLAGCVTPVDPAAEQRAATTAPVCYTEKECEIEWAAARTWVLDNASMKIETYSADYIQTYNPPNDIGVDVAVTVTKDPLSDGAYRIRAKIWCANVYVCPAKAVELTQKFNDTVSAAGQSAP